MKKYIKLDKEKIIEIRPLDEEIDHTDYIKVELPEGNDIFIMQNYLYKNNKFVKTDTIVNAKKSLQERLEILGWLQANDYIANKIVFGEWAQDDPRYVTYLKERAAKRARLDELGE